MTIAIKSKQKITIINPKEGGVFLWVFRYTSFCFLLICQILFCISVGFYRYFSIDLPPLSSLEESFQRAPLTSKIYAADGSILAELGEQQREWASLEEFSPLLVSMLLGIEDQRFYEHHGLDFKGLLRAVITNIRAKEIVQGGSTLTQQMAKLAYLSKDRRFTRKIREAILARRIEHIYTKTQILLWYLNNVFLGHNRYGFLSASLYYFGKTPAELGSIENAEKLALLIALVRAPTEASPLLHPQQALLRRNQVLSKLAKRGIFTQKQVEILSLKPLGISFYPDYFRERSPYFVEHIRKKLVKQWGPSFFSVGGYRIETTLIPRIQRQAEQSVLYTLHSLDKRQGYRGPIARLKTQIERKKFLQKSLEIYTTPLEENRFYLGLVLSVSSDKAIVQVGKSTFPLPLANASWAVRYSKSDSTNNRSIQSLLEALHVGDVIWVKLSAKSKRDRFTEVSYDEKGEPHWLPETHFPSPSLNIWSLEQIPNIQGAAYAIDWKTGYVLAMVGGEDFDRSEFNRVTMSCRQPGSAYKPIYYSLALEKGYDYESRWNDKVKLEIDPDTGKKQLLKNIDQKYENIVSLARALIWSKNPPSQEIFNTLGAKQVAAWAQNFGMSTKVIADKGLALGSSCVLMDEITRAYGIFATMGKPVEPIEIKRIIDRNGSIIYENASYEDVSLSSGQRLAAILQTAGRKSNPVISPRTAFLTDKLLRRVVQEGHSGIVRALKIPAALKTGTSSGTSDTWAIGHTDRVLLSTAVGTEFYGRQLGYKEASFTVALPLWASILYTAHKYRPAEEIPKPPASVSKDDEGGPLKEGMPLPPVEQKEKEEKEKILSQSGNPAYSTKSK